MGDARITISVRADDPQDMQIVKEEIKSRLITSAVDYFKIINENNHEITVYFGGENYSMQNRMMDSFDKIVLAPIRERECQERLIEEQAN